VSDLRSRSVEAAIDYDNCNFAKNPIDYTR
jgi:hypothetical protein